MSKRRSGANAAAVGLFALLSAIAHPAQAWTETEVETLSADVEVDRGGAVHVRMRVQLHVRAGWLERFEVAGLDEGYALEGDVRFRSTEGQRLEPRVRRRDDGRLQFEFQRRSAPRRGDYLVEFGYRADIASTARPEGDRVRYDWTLPGWRTGLDGVRVSIRGAGLRFAESEDALATIGRERTEQDGLTRLTWTRAHLPRTIHWTMGFTMPSAASATSAPSTAHASAAEADGDSPDAATTGAASASRATVAPATSPHTDHIAFWLALFSLASMLLFRGRATRHGCRTRPLIPLPTAIRALAMLSLGAASLLVDLGDEALLATIAIIAAVGLERMPVLASPPRLGAWRYQSSTERMRVWHRPWDGLFDLGSLLGVAHLSVTAIVVVSTQTPTGWHLALLLPWLTGCGAQLPSCPSDKRQRLLRFAGDLRASLAGSSYAIALAVHEDARAHLQDVRLRIATEKRAPGLLRFDVCCGDQPGPGGLHAKLRILVVTREETLAASRMVARYGAENGQRSPGGRTVWTAEVDELEELVTLLGRPAPKKRRSQRKRRVNRVEGVQARG